MIRVADQWVDRFLVVHKINMGNNMSLAKKILESRPVSIIEEEMDFDKGDLRSLWAFISKRMENKSAAKQADMFSRLTEALMKELKEVPSGEVKLRNVLKAFKSEHL